jgi:hypothetical protein
MVPGEPCMKFSKQSELEITNFDLQGHLPWIFIC